MAFIRTDNSNTVKIAKTKQKTPKNQVGNYGVRTTMSNMGLDNSKIGWDNGAVTYNNKSFKPSSVENGVSYAPVSDIQEFVNDIYKSEGKNPVRVTDYASPAGLGSISYSDNGLVSVGEENIPILYMDGDRAVVDSNDLDRAYGKLMQKIGLEKPSDMYNEWQGKYASALNDAYKSLTSQKEWSYNPENDPVYKAYSDMYKREGERAYRDAAAKMATKNNGNMTSAAQTVAGNQLLYYMSQLADRIPALAENSYNRYKNEQDTKLDAYNLLSKNAELDWNNKSDSQNLAREDYRRSRQSEQERDENSRVRREDEQSIKAAAWANAEKRGFFTDTEAELWDIPKKQDGTYVTPSDIKIAEETLYFNNVTKPELSYKSDLSTAEMWEKYNAAMRNNSAKAAQNYANQKNLAAYKASRSLANSKSLAAYKEALKYSNAY